MKPDLIAVYALSVGSQTLISFDALSKGKGKAIPLQSSTGPEGSRRLRLSYFKTVGS